MYTRITRVYIFFALFNSFHAIHTSVHVALSVSISSIPCFLFFFIFFLFFIYLFIRSVLTSMGPSSGYWIVSTQTINYFTHILIFSEVVLFLHIKNFLPPSPPHLTANSELTPTGQNCTCICWLICEYHHCSYHHCCCLQVPAKCVVVWFSLCSVS